MKETVDIEILVTSWNGDRKIMQSSNEQIKLSLRRFPLVNILVDLICN